MKTGLQRLRFRKTHPHTLVDKYYRVKLPIVPEDLGTAARHHTGRKSYKDPGRKPEPQEPELALEQD